MINNLNRTHSPRGTSFRWRKNARQEKRGGEKEEGETGSEKKYIEQCYRMDNPVTHLCTYTRVLNNKNR